MVQFRGDNCLKTDSDKLSNKLEKLHETDERAEGAIRYISYIYKAGPLLHAAALAIR